MGVAIGSSRGLVLGRRRRHWLGIALATFALCGWPQPGQAQPREEYRGFWVDTFNTTLNNHDDIVAVVGAALASNANALFVQVRRRGDSWYLNSLEPLPDLDPPIEEGFDPLQDLIVQAHSRGLEVHAFVIIGALWNRDPVLFPPRSGSHVFNLHGFNQATGDLYEGRDNWLTRTLLPDRGSISRRGHRFGAEFWMDPGHPDAAAYTVDVLMQLVASYDIDGLHLDRIRYPELSISDPQTPTTGTSIGYNETSVERFQRRYGIAPGSPPPAQNDPRWNDWRRDQVSQLVRRIYLNAIAINPQLKISAALIAFGNGPTDEASWNRAEAYWRVYQDWRAWTAEGVLDLAIPMNYKRENNDSHRIAFDQWNEWTKNHAFNRWVLCGQGAFLNAIEGTLRQTRRALDPSTSGNLARGVLFFSQATSNVAVASNRFSVPPGRNTPARDFAEFASALTTGRSVDGMELFEDPDLQPVPVFVDPAMVPPMPWKIAPQKGHVMGFARRRVGAMVDAAGKVLDAAEEVLDTSDGVIWSENGAELRITTDGGGFYGGVDLNPGVYYVTLTPPGEASFTAGPLTVAAGQVTRLDVVIDRP